jgi:hypothetical protein
VKAVRSEEEGVRSPIVRVGAGTDALSPHSSLLTLSLLTVPWDESIM